MEEKVPWQASGSEPEQTASEYAFQLCLLPLTTI